MENKKFNVKFEGEELVAGLDLNQDGEELLKLKLKVNEAIQEAISRGEAVEGVKLVDFSFQLTKMVLKLDTDKDGEHLLELEIDLAEVLDETGLMKQS